MGILKFSIPPPGIVSKPRLLGMLYPTGKEPWTVIAPDGLLLKLGILGLKL
jgi:hypothetical protein